MKKSIVIITCLTVMLTINLNAQTKAEKPVMAAVETLKQAMLDGNRAQLEALAADELIYGHSSGKMETKSAFVESLASGKSDFITINLSEQSIVLEGKTALVRHKLTGTTKDNGVDGTVNLGVLLVWQKNDGKWKLLARQAFKLP